MDNNLFQLIDHNFTSFFITLICYNFFPIINIIIYIPKINDYLEILTDEEVKDFLDIDFSEYFKSISKELNLRGVTKSLYFFLTTFDKVQTNFSDNCIHCIMLRFSIFLV